jgi:L-fuconolactonase
MLRRTLLKSAMGVAVTAAAGGGAAHTSPDPANAPVIDAHIHLFDPTRKGGIPWPEPANTALFRPALPPRYAKLAQPHGVAGAIAVEASPWLVDNFWLQSVVEQYPMMVGFVGNLLPESPDFAATLDFLHRSPLFLGIRYGNLWDRDLGKAVENPHFIAGLKLVAQAGLVLETANPDPALIAACVLVTDRVPELRLVLDHLPHALVPDDAALGAKYDANLRELAQRPSVFVKGSEIVREINGRVALDVAVYKDQLDRLWDRFGEDRIFFGSDWPNSDSLAGYDQTFGLAKSYIESRSAQARDKYFWKNSIAVYRWKARTVAQQALTQYT